MIYDQSNGDNSADFEWPPKSFLPQAVQMWFIVQLCSTWRDFNWQRVAWSLCDSWASCYICRLLLLLKALSVNLWSWLFRPSVWSCMLSRLERQGLGLDHEIRRYYLCLEFEPFSKVSIIRLTIGFYFDGLRVYQTDRHTIRRTWTACCISICAMPRDKN